MMIKVNLLKGRAVVSSEVQSIPSAGVDVLSDFQLDQGFNTFEYSQLGQAVKLLLLMVFIAPLIIFERMRDDDTKKMVDLKVSEVQLVRDIKFEKEEEIKRYSGLATKKDFFLSRDLELKDVKAGRLLAVKSVDVIQTSIPSDVWVTNLSFEKKLVQIKGRTLVDTGLDAFVQRLKLIRGFSDVNVSKDVKVKSSNGKTLNEFLIILNVAENLEVEEAGI